MNRDEVLAVIDAAYAARVAGDLATMRALAAEDGTFELAGETTLLRNFPVAGRVPSLSAVNGLISLIRMIEIERLEAVVEGNRAAVLLHARMSFAGRPPFDTVLYDFVELDDDGRISTMIQFSDTARYAAEMEALQVLHNGG
jgi:ketosteroid isomerase-like protein